MEGLYLSTGTFIGRVNGRNWHLLTRYHECFHCDGFEFMIYEVFQPEIKAIVKEYTSEGIPIPVVHSMKTIGDFMSDPNGFSTAKDMVRFNCETAAALGAKKIVVHCWGKPLSDTYFEMICERIGLLRETADSYGLELLPENSFCIHGSPFAHFESLSRQYREIGFILDTRCAEFHGELELFGNSDLLRAGRIRHIHINDYKGGYKDWDAMYPIPQPGDGQIRWDMFFASLKKASYEGSVTLEAPSMSADGVDSETLNRSLDFIRTSLQT